MERREFLKIAGVGAGTAAVASWLAAPLAGAAEEPATSGGRRPNILLFQCHDLGQFLHCYGVKTVRTPNLDAFAAQGVRFPRMYCTAPQCSPSRASLFTGRWPHNNGVMGLCHAEFAWDLNPEERHLGQFLRDAGYATACIGTMHETRSKFQRCGYEKRLSDRYAQKATDNAIAILKQLAPQAVEKPFFMYVGTSEPHRQPYPAPTWPGSLPGDNGFPGPHLKPDDSLGVEVPPYLRDTEGARRELAGLQGAVRHVDEQFGRLLAALKESGAEADTLVVFTTDHGIAMPRAKCSLYDPGVSVAFLLRLPSRKGWHGGVEPTAMVSNIDVLPTILDLVGVSVPANVQGRSLAPLLDGKPYEPRREIFTEMTYHNYYDPRRAIRTETHKLIVNFSTAPAFMDPSGCWRPQSDTVTPPNGAATFSNHVELYDLTRDPWEQNDLSGKPAAAPVLADLLARLHKHLVETADPILQGAVASPHHGQALALLERR